MALKRWFQDMNPNDCLEDNVTWNDMTNYIRHSSCTTFTIYSTCSNSGQAFKFTQAGTMSTSYGGTNAGDDRQWRANDADTYPYIEGLGGSHLKFYTGNDIYFYDNAVKMFSFTYGANKSYLIGGAATGDDLILKANDTDTYPYIELLGDSHIKLYSSDDVYFYDDATEEFRFYDNSVDIKGDRAIYINDDETYIGHGAGDNIGAGINNTLVGHDAGQANTFNNCTLFGYEAGKNNAASNRLYINNSNSAYPLIYGEFDNDIVKFGDNSAAWFMEFEANTINIAGDRAIYINDDETYIGHGAGDNIGAGTGNTLVGHDAGQANTFNSSTLVGYETGKNNTQSNITAVGYQAGKGNQGEYNTFIGRLCGYNTTITGANNTFVGNYTALSLTLGQKNTGIGTTALNGITTGNNNIAFGTDAQSNNNVSNIVALGIEACRYNTQSNIVAVGYQALLNNTGLGNHAFGYNCLDANTSGAYNTGVGYNALTTNITGSSNTALGYDAGANTATTISNCVYVGYGAGKNNTTSNCLYINNSDSTYPLIYGEFNNDKVKFGDNNAYWFAQILHENAGGQLFLKECTTPTTQAGFGAIYTKADNKLYCQTGDGVEHEVAFA